MCHHQHPIPSPEFAPRAKRAGDRSGEGAHSVLEQLLLDRAHKPSTAWREEHPWAAPALLR